MDAKTRSVDIVNSPVESRRATSYNMMVAPSADLDPNSLSHPRGGKRHTNIHGEPVSATYQAQIEYLDKIASKYQELIHTEEQMKTATDSIDNQKYQAKIKAQYEKAAISRKLQHGQL